MDNESPDHAGLRGDARALADEFYSDGVRPKEMAEVMTQYGITCWSAGRDSLAQLSVQELMEQLPHLARHIEQLDDVRYSNVARITALEAQEAELATLRGELSSANAFGDKCTESIEEMGIEVTTLRADRARLQKDNAQLQRDLATAVTKLASERGTSEVLAEMYYRDPAEAAKMLNIMRQIDTLSNIRREALAEEEG